jgi:formate C-acetyltransferase
MPNGRRVGDYLSQGLSPSRYQQPITVVELLKSVRSIDMKKFAANTSLTITLPLAKLDLERIVELFRSVARSGVQSLQPNCVNVQDLINAQIEPEKYWHIIVRVCGFSAPFISLAKHYQDEIISRASLGV